MIAAPPLRTAEDASVEIARRGEIVDREGKVEWRLGHG
jgi:hypothetical protein